MKKNVKYLISSVMAALILCSLNGCESIDDNGRNDNGDTIQIISGAEENQTVEEDSLGNAEENVPNEEESETETETEIEVSGEDLDMVVPNAADDDWYMKGNVYTDDQGNRLEVFFNDEGTIEFAVNGLSLYFTVKDNFQQENNWKIYTCDDGTMIIYYPGEPAHLEISDGDYAGLYEAGGDFNDDVFNE